MTNTNVPQWEDRFDERFKGWILQDSQEFYRSFDEVKSEINQAIQEERQRIVDMIEKKYSDHGAYEEWNVVREIINLIHKE